MIINKQRLQALEVFNGAYKNHTGRELCGIRGAYKTASNDKWREWDKCRELCREHDGSGLTICSANPYIFTAGFVFKDASGAACFMYITKTRRVAVRIEDGGEPAGAWA